MSQIHTDLLVVGQKKKRKNNRKKGDRNEYKTIDRLTKQGYHCVRAGGSLGIFDIVAIPSDDSLVKLIQCKSFKPKKYVRKDGKISTYNPSYDQVIQYIKLRKVTSHCAKELWKWKLYAKHPEIVRIQNDLFG